MPIIGERAIKDKNKNYSSKLSGLASEFRNLASNMLHEQGIDIFQESSKIMLNNVTNDTMKNFFVENSYDPAGFSSAEELNDHIEMMEEQYKNDREAVMEYAAMSSMNPVIGMTFPIHKNILMNCIFDKGAIPKAVAKAPKFTESVETRYLVSADGKKKIDIFKSQRQIKDIMDSSNPIVDVTIDSFPFNGTGKSGTDKIINAFSSFDDTIDNLDIGTCISKVTLTITKDEGGTEDADFNVNIRFVPSYGEYDRTFIEPVIGSDGKELVVLSGTMKDNAISIQPIKLATNVVLKSVVVSARKDPSNGRLNTPTVKWDVKTDIIEIGNANPINVPISPEEVKDISALYQINQLDKVMSLINTVLENYKDDTIKEGLDRSFNYMAPDQKVEGEFDFAPRGGYLSDHIDWREHTFMDALDTYVTDLLTVLNDQNVTITVFGRPDLIRKISPTEYTYSAPSSIGPVELEFSKTVVTSDRRVYNFISSQKLQGNYNPATGETTQNNQLIIILNPRNTDRFIYRIYDYQMYVSNEIRNNALYTLPAVHAFERFKFCEYQPVQGRINILNPTGIRNASYADGGTDAEVYTERTVVGTASNRLTSLN